MRSAFGCRGLLGGTNMLLVRVTARNPSLQSLLLNLSWQACAYFDENARMLGEQVDFLESHCCKYVEGFEDLGLSHPQSGSIKSSDKLEAGACRVIAGRSQGKGVRL